MEGGAWSVTVSTDGEGAGPGQVPLRTGCHCDSVNLLTNRKKAEL